MFSDAAEQAKVGGSLEVQLLLGPAQLLAGDLSRGGNKPRDFTSLLRPRPPCAEGRRCLTSSREAGGKDRGGGEPGTRTRWARKAARMCR